MDFRENYSTKIDSGRERIGNRFLTTSSRVEASSSRERNSRRFVYLSGRAILGFSARFVPERTFSRRKGCFCPPSPLLPSARLNSLSRKIILAREISQHFDSTRTKADRPTDLSLRETTRFIVMRSVRSPERNTILFRGKCTTRIIKQLSTFHPRKLCRHAAAFKILPQSLLIYFERKSGTQPSLVRVVFKKVIVNNNTSFRADIE